MKQSLKLTGLAVLLGVAATPAVAQEKIKVGIIVTLSGPAAVLGQQSRDGFQLAVKDLGGKMAGVDPPDFIAQRFEQPILMRREQHGASGTSQTIECGQRARADNGILQRHCLIEREYGRGSKVQRVAGRDITALRRSLHLASLRLHRPAGELQ